MNIADRGRKYREAARVLRPGGRFVIYEVRAGTTPGMLFPVPRAEDAKTRHLVSAPEMRHLLAEAGFSLREAEDRIPLVLKHHREKRAEASPPGNRHPRGCICCRATPQPGNRGT